MGRQSLNGGWKWLGGLAVLCLTLVLAADADARGGRGGCYSGGGSYGGYCGGYSYGGYCGGYSYGGYCGSYASCYTPTYYHCYTPTYYHCCTPVYYHAPVYYHCHPHVIVVPTKPAGPPDKGKPKPGTPGGTGPGGGEESTPPPGQVQYYYPNQIVYTQPVFHVPAQLPRAED